MILVNKSIGVLRPSHDTVLLRHRMFFFFFSLANLVTEYNVCHVHYIRDEAF